MKILLVSTYFFIFGGAERYLFDLAKLLEENGHEVIFFCMNHPKNFSSKYSKYFVSYFPPFDKITLFGKIKYFFRFFYNFEAKRKFRKLILDEKPDIIHINILSYELTYSILMEAKKQKIPIVMTLHDYRLICPQIAMLCRRKTCYKCSNGTFIYCLIKVCINRNLFKSTLLTLFNYFNIHILKIIKDINLFISPSHFLFQKFKGSTLFRDSQIIHISNYIDVFNIVPHFQNTEKSIVYFGRIDFEKGINVLIEAVRKLDILVKIIGSGSLDNFFRKKVIQESISNVHLMGFVSFDIIKKEVARSLFVVVPSIWYENFPFNILESFALGKPVIASAIGGITELVKDNVTGFLFRVGDSDELKYRIQYLINQPNLIREMGKNARNWVKEYCSPDKFYQSLHNEYKKLCG